jgi:hypothetical protein
MSRIPSSVPSPTAAPAPIAAGGPGRGVAILAAVLAALAAGCTGSIGNGAEDTHPVSVESSNGKLTVTKPLAGSLLGSRSVRVAGVLEGDATKVLVNGALELDVDENGVFEGTAIIAEDGAATINVTVMDLVANVDVEIDSTPPVVTIESPAPASFVRGGDVQFKGRVDDAHLDSLTIGDEKINLRPDGTFDQMIPIPPGSHRMRAIATDGLDHQGFAFTSFISGSFVSTYAMHPASVVVKLGSNTIDTVAAAAVPYMSPYRITNMLTKLNPVIDYWWGKIYFEGEDHKLAVIQLTPRNGYIEVIASLVNVRIPYRLDHFLPGVITGDVTVGYAEARGRLNVSVENGVPRAWASSLDVTLLDFFVDMAGWPDVIDRKLVSGIAHDHVVNALRGHMAVWIPKALDEAVKDLPMSGNVTVMGKSGKISAKPALLGVSSLGIRAVMDMNVQATTRDFELTGDAPGPIVFGRGAVPTSSTDPNIEAAVSLDLLNSTAYAAWSTGGLSHRIENVKMSSKDTEPLTVGALSLLVPGVKKLAPADAPIAAEIWAALPPVLQAKEGALVDVHAPDVRVMFLAKGAADDGTDVPLFTTSIGAHAPVSVKIVSDSVSVSIGALDFDADVVGDSPSGLDKGEELDDFVWELAEPYVKQYSYITGLKVPSVMGYKINASNAQLTKGYFRANGRLTKAN